MSAYSECYASSVNRWECDENDHMNVRFHLRKSMEVLHLGLVDLGLFDSGQLGMVNDCIRSQHMRFLAEARFSTPIIGRMGVIAVENKSALVLTELLHGFTNKVLANIVHDIQLPEETNGNLAGLTLIKLPDNAGPRSVDAEDTPHEGVTRASLLAGGFKAIGGGVIQEIECERGVMAWHMQMGRVSDLIPALWSQLLGTHENPEDSGIGRAVLEHRLIPYNNLAAGSRFEVLSAFTAIQGKAQELTHFMIDLEHDRPVFCSKVMAIIFDLATRKAMELPKADEELVRKSIKIVQAQAQSTNNNQQ